MKPLLQLSGLIDRLNELLGRLVMWLVLAAVLISTANAIIRKALEENRNATTSCPVAARTDA